MAFRCLDCGWYVECSWHSGLDGLSMGAAALRMVSQIEESFGIRAEYAGEFQVSDSTWPEVCAKLGIAREREEYCPCPCHVAGEGCCPPPPAEFTTDDWSRWLTAAMELRDGREGAAGGKADGP